MDPEILLFLIGISLYPFVCASIVLFFLGRFGTWNRLAEHYRLGGEFTGERWRFQTGHFSILQSYGTCLAVGANTQGLYLALNWPFHSGHPPLFVPWTEVAKIEEKELWFMRVVEFRFFRTPNQQLWLSPRLTQRIASVAGEAFPAHGHSFSDATVTL